MPGSKSAYLESALLDEALGGTDWAPPGTIYVALSTAPFDPTATGAAMNEVAGGSYARVALTNNGTNFPAAAGSYPASKAIGVDVGFTTATADWGTIYSAYLVDASGAGNILYGADAVTPIPLPNGSTLVIQAGTWNFLET
jgi:hypothetical protein